MVWFHVDDGLTTNPKVLQIPREHRMAAIGLWTMAGSWCGKHLTNGVVPRFMLEEWGASDELAGRLVEVGMWKRNRGNYTFQNWDEYQETKEEVEARRKWERERKKKRRADQKANTPEGVPVDVPMGHPGDSHRDSDHPFPSLPFPSLPFPSLPIPISASRGDAESSRKKPELPLPKTWAPTADHVKRARDRGVDLLVEVENFRLHAETHDRRAANWNGAFTMWLNKARPQAAAVVEEGQEWLAR